MISIYQCPVCGQPLDLEQRQYRCANGHSFDVASEGYVNLLLAHQKRSKDAGDSKAMLASRRAFLEQGHYDILPDFLARHLAVLSSEGPLRLLDAGCGEGYYTGFVQRRLGERITCWGTDIAKPGIAMAAKRYRDIRFFVASTYRLPIQDNVLDVVTRIYAPGDTAEFARVLVPGGWLITVIPGRRHLFGLKEYLYDHPQEHEADEPVPEGFIRHDQHTLAGPLHLASPADIGHLLAMTPYYWHAPPDRQERVNQLEGLDTDIEFVVSVYRRAE